MRLVISVFLMLLFNFLGFSQAKQEKYSEEFEGGIVSPKAPPVVLNQKVHLLKILKYDNKGLLSGNNCVAEETAKMGFEFLIVCNKDYESTRPLYVFFYNFGTRLELTFKNGPGWSMRLKQKIKECKRNTADWVW